MSGGWSVYIHTNKENGKRYIGITGRKPERRWRDGIGYKYNSHFYNAILRHGWDGFTHETVCSGLCVQEAEVMEQDLISKYNTTDRDYGYNHTFGGNANRPSEDACQRMRESSFWRGKPGPNAGKHISEATRGKLITARAGRIIKPETGLKISQSLRGKVCSAETRAKIGSANKGKPGPMTGRSQSQSARNKLSAFRTGKVTSDETKAKLSAINQGKTLSAETRAKIGNAIRGENNPKSKRVKNIETGEMFASSTQAAKECGISHQSISRSCLIGRPVSHGGNATSWAYVNKNESEERKCL